MVLLTVGAKAQNEVGEWSLKPFVGISSTRLTNMPNIPVVYDIALKRDFLPGFEVGAEVGYQVTDRFCVTAGLGYALQGGKWKDFQLSDASNISIKNTKLMLGYVQLPVMAQVYLVEGLSLKAGVQLGLLTNARMTNRISATIDGTSIDEDMDESVMDDANKLDIAIPFGIAFEFENGFVLEARYKLGLSKVEKEDEDGRGHMRNHAFALTVGYKFSL